MREASPEIIPAEAITSQAIKILAAVADARRKYPPPARTGMGTLVFADDLLSEPIDPKGHVPANVRPDVAFEEGIRWWAVAVAPAITFDEWETMVWAARDANPRFPGDSTRFFETAFEGLRLKCGTSVYP